MSSLARILLRTVAGAAVLGVPACGGGGGAGGASSDFAAISVSLGSAPSEDVTSFTVAVDAIEFRRASGATVDFLQQPATVDLAALGGATQDLGIEEVATGGFVGATVTLDFTNTACFLAGQSTAAALNDTSGQPLTGLVTVDLDLTRAPFFAFARQHHAVELDFDLAPSLTIDAAANTVVVAPALVVRVDRVDARTICTCGALKGMDPATGTAALDLESESGQAIGLRTVVFDPTTVFHVDGVPHAGAAGLAALAAKPAGTWVEAYGAVDPLRERVVAAYVEAGSCTRHGGQDVVDGVIVARSGAAGSDATLTVVGASVAAGGAQQFAGTFTVSAAFATTRVVRAGDAGLFDSDALNVGQTVRAYGTLGGATLDATAASALVRELPTTLFGHAVGTPSGTTLTVALGRVGPLDPASITWSDGGPTPPDPTLFTLDFSSIGGGLSIADGAPLIAQVFLAKVDDAADDAAAVTIADLTAAPALLLVRDRAGGFVVSAAPSPDQLQLTLTGAPDPDEEAALDFGVLGRQALPDTPDPLLVAAKLADVFELRHVGSDTVACYVLFDEFEAALAAALAGGAALRDCTAVGAYDAPTNTLRATSAIVVVE